LLLLLLTGVFVGIDGRFCSHTATSAITKGTNTKLSHH
jgi:hypothetical protein